MEDMIRIQNIYEEISEYLGWDDDYDVDIESRFKLLRNKFAFLMKKAVLRDRKEFKQGGNIYVPLRDAPVIKALLIKAVSNEEEDELIVKWFNGKINTKDPWMASSLRAPLFLAIYDLLYLYQIDDVTAEEWMAAIDASINYNTSTNTISIMNEIQDFRESALALNQNIGIGDVIGQNEHGERFYRMRGQREPFDIANTPLCEVLKHVHSQDDYLNILAQVLQLLEGDALQKAIERIKTCLQFRDTFGFSKADDYIDKDSLASEYVIWFQRVYEFLDANPTILSKIQEETGYDDVLNYFKMQDR